LTVPQVVTLLGCPNNVSTANTLCTGNDTRLSNARTPSGSAAGAGSDLAGTYPYPQVIGLGGDALPANIVNGFLKRTTAGTAWEEVPYGTGADTVCQGNDSRFYNLPTNVQGGAAYTLVLADRAKCVEANGAAATTITIDASIFGVGDCGEICQTGSGPVTIAAATGTTLHSNGDKHTIAARYSTIAWRVSGITPGPVVILSGDLA